MGFWNLRICLLVLITCSFIYLTSSASKFSPQNAPQKRHGKPFAEEYYYIGPPQIKKRDMVRKNVPLLDKAKKDISLNFPRYEFYNWHLIAHKVAKGSKGAYYYIALTNVEVKPLKYEETPIAEKEEKFRCVYIVYSPNLSNLYQYHVIFKGIPLTTEYYDYIPMLNFLKDKLKENITRR